MPIVFAPPTTFLYVLHARRIVKHWHETPYDELPDAPALTRVCVNHGYEGDIEGESWEEYLMVRHSRATCQFVSLERVIGSIDGRAGSFVVQYDGTYQNGIRQGRLTLVSASATGGLAGLRGSGTFISIDGSLTTLTLRCSFH